MAICLEKPRFTIHGVSLILLNSIQGEKIWQKIKDNLRYRVSNIKDASAENVNLVRKTEMPPIRKYCYTIIKERGYKDVAETEFSINKIKASILLLKYKIVNSKLYKKIKNIYNQ